MKLIQNSKFKIHNFLTPICLIILSTIIACSSTTEVSKGSLTGNINLEGLEDHSGIIVALYDLAYLDTTIVRINNQYPQIGVKINQHTEFDHRLQSPVLTAQTNTDGSFDIEDLPTGIYNFVAIKDGWGFKYVYEVVISEGDNELPDEPELYEETIISGYFEEQNNYFLTDHHYVIEDNTELLPNQYMEIQPGAVIRINSGFDLTIHGTIKAQGFETNMFWVTSNDRFGEELTQFNSLQYYHSMELSSLASVEDNLIQWGKWDWGEDTLILNNQHNLEVTNTIFEGQNTGIYILYSDNTYISNAIAQDSMNESNAAIFYYASSENEISKNIILDNYVGIKNQETVYTNINNNYISNCQEGIRNLIESHNTVIEYNEIVNSNKAIVNIGDSTVYVYYNNIFAITGIKNAGISSHQLYAYSISRYNNFNCDLYAIECRGILVTGDIIDTKQNWWNTIEIDEIECLIWDKNDANPELPTYNFIAIVEYEPFLTQEAQDAGIQ